MNEWQLKQLILMCFTTWKMSVIIYKNVHLAFSKSGYFGMNLSTVI